MNLYEPVPLSDLSPEEAKRLMRESEEREPVLWKKCYPKNYHPYKADQYPSPKIASHQLLAIALKIQLGMIGQSEKYEMLWACDMVRNAVPQYWVEKELLDAILHTTPPMSLDWYNMPMPRSAMAFLLPRGSLVHKEEGNVSFIAYGRHRAHQELPTYAKAGPRTWTSTNGGMILLSHTEGKYLTHWNIPYDAIPVVNLAALHEMVAQHDQHQHTTGWLTAPNMTKEDTRVGALVAHLIFGLLLFMERKPEIVSQGKLLKRLPAKRGEMPREFWDAPVLGRDYKIRRVPGPGLGGTHASPREHWVRGFWREQPYGPGNSLRKDVLIDPYLRGGE